MTLQTDGGRETGADYAVRVPSGGSVEVESEEGDVAGGGARTDTGNAELAPGDVSLEDLIFGTLETTAETGDVTLSGRLSGDGRVSVDTNDVIVRVPPEDAVELTLETLVVDVSREPPEEEGPPEDQSGGNE